MHPLAKAAIRKGTATDEKSVVDGRFFTAQTENNLCAMMPKLVEGLKNNRSA